MAALGKQPTPCLCLALLFALLHSVTFGFAACSNLHTKVGRQQPPGISPARLLPPGNDGRTGKLTPCTREGLTSLAACKGTSKSKQQSLDFACCKQSHSCLRLGEIAAAVSH